MRKKTGRSNQKRFRPSCLFGRRGEDDESDWFLLEADLSTAAPRRKPASSRRATLIRLLAVACLCVTIPVGAKWIHDKVFYRNDEFVLRALDIASDGSLSAANLAEIANVSTGRNLMELDLDEIRVRIEKLAVIKAVVVEREMPDRLSIRVEERVPIAWLSCPPLGLRPGDMERGFLVDGDGVLFRCLDLTDGVRDLPVIETFRMAEPVEGDRLAVDGGKGALELLASAHRLSLFPGMEPRTIHLRSEWSIQCEFSGGMNATFAKNEVKRGLDDLLVILQRAAELGTTVASANVAPRENIPVVFSDVITPAVARKASTEPFEAAANDAEDQRQKHLRLILKGG